MDILPIASVDLSRLLKSSSFLICIRHNPAPCPDSMKTWEREKTISLPTFRATVSGTRWMVRFPLAPFILLFAAEEMKSFNGLFVQGTQRQTDWFAFSLTPDRPKALLAKASYVADAQSCD